MSDNKKISGGGSWDRPLVRLNVDVPFPIVIKVWSGEERHDLKYIRRSLPRLLASSLPPNARVIAIDDCSPDPRLQPFLRGLVAENSQFEVWTNPSRLGPNAGQAFNFPKVVEQFPEAEFFVMCDDDIVYHPGWLQRLVAVANEARQQGINGVFSALNYKKRPTLHSVELRTSRVLVKERSAALNWLLPRDVYEYVGPFRDDGAAFDTDYFDRMQGKSLYASCLTPSYVQNIGYLGAYQASNSHRAPDYIGHRDWFMLLQDLEYFIRSAPRHLNSAIPEGRVRRMLKNIHKSLWENKNA